MTRRYFRCGNYSFDLSKKTLVMGILNITPDSFSDAGKFLIPEKALEQAYRMAEEGADIIDIGGESTRPGALKISAEEELKRVLPVLKKLAKKLRIPVSLDTYKYEVARAGLAEGASIINDISGLGYDPKIAELTAKAKAGLVLMHIRGTPADMQSAPYYKDVIKEIKACLKKKINLARSFGNNKDRLIIDLGIGFGKTPEHNLKILKNTGEFVKLGYPVLIGVSRKSFIGKLTGGAPEERLEGSLASMVLAVEKGAELVRVHDVKPSVLALKVTNAVQKV